MGTGLRVEIVDRERNALVLQSVFHDFPITIGRDPIADINLGTYPFVSKFHAKIELRADGAVMLRDTGSANGTSVGSPTATIPPLEWIDLRGHGLAFMIGPVHFALEVVEAPRAPDSRERGGGAMLSSDPGRPFPTARVEGAGIIAMSVEARDIAEELRTPYQNYRAAWTRFYERLADRLQSKQLETRTQVLQLLAQEYPAMFGEPDFQRMAKHLGVSIAELRPPSAQREEDAALGVLRDLVEWYGLGPLEGPEAVILVAKKIQDAVDALCMSYVRQRDGLRAFETQFEVASRAPASPASRLESARNPREVGRLLLDWKNPADLTHGIRTLIADLAVHEMGFTNGVVKGATALVAKLSPAAILAEYNAEKRKKNSRVGFWGGHFKKLWHFFEHYHRDVSREEKETLAVLFGREFAQAYYQVSANAVPIEEPPPEKRTKSEAPPKPSQSAVDAIPTKAVEKTPETHGFPPTKGPTGTIVVPRVLAPRPNAGPMTKNPDTPSGTEGRN